MRRTRLPRSQSHIGDTTSRFHEHHLAGERVSTRAVLICRSFAAAKFKLAIRMRRSSRPWIAWMEYFGSSCWPVRGARKPLRLGPLPSCLGVGSGCLRGQAILQTLFVSITQSLDHGRSREGTPGKRWYPEDTAGALIHCHRRVRERLQDNRASLIKPRRLT